MSKKTVGVRLKQPFTHHLPPFLHLIYPVPHPMPPFLHLVCLFKHLVCPFEHPMSPFLQPIILFKKKSKKSINIANPNIFLLVFQAGQDLINPVLFTISICNAPKNKKASYTRGLSYFQTPPLSFFLTTNNHQLTTIPY